MASCSRSTPTPLSVVDPRPACAVTAERDRPPAPGAARNRLTGSATGIVNCLADAEEPGRLTADEMFALMRANLVPEKLELVEGRLLAAGEAEYVFAPAEARAADPSSQLRRCRARRPRPSRRGPIPMGGHAKQEPRRRRELTLSQDLAKAWAPTLGVSFFHSWVAVVRRGQCLGDLSTASPSSASETPSARAIWVTVDHVGLASPRSTRAYAETVRPASRAIASWDRSNDSRRRAEPQ
jgi:hypothetical protein